MKQHRALPDEILLQVCNHLTCSPLEDVAAFALVCKGWNAIVKDILHRSISFVITGRDRLVRDVIDCASSLQRSSSLHHVRSLEIAGPGPYSDETNVHHHSPGWRFVSENEYLGDIMDETIINPRSPTPPFSLKMDHRIGGLKAWETVPESSWQPLVLLITRMPALSHVVHNCASAVPLNLVAALEHQRCKLHVNTLRIPELDIPLDTAFLTLITSSSLNSIRAAYLPTSMLQGTRFSATVELWHDEEALMRLVAGVTPRLTKLTILRKHGGILPTGTSKVPWDGFRVPGQDLPGFCPGNLEELALLHPDIIDLENIRAWGTHVTLEVLRVLKISSPTTAEALYYLSSEALTHLRQLSFAVYKKQSRSDAAIKAANHFLLTLRPLSVLRLDQNVQSLSLVRIVAHHATCLRKLWLLPVKELDSHNLASAEYYIPSLEVLNELKKSCIKN